MEAAFCGHPPTEATSSALPGDPSDFEKSNKKSGNHWSLHFIRAYARLRLSPVFSLHQSPPIGLWYVPCPDRPNLVINLAGITTLKQKHPFHSRLRRKRADIVYAATPLHSSHVPSTPFQHLFEPYRWLRQLSILTFKGVMVIA